MLKKISWKEKFVDNEIYIFGAGKRAKKIWAVLKGHGVEICGYIDKYKSGTRVDDIEVLDIEGAIKRSGLKCNIIVSPKDNKEIVDQLEDLALENVYDGEELVKLYNFVPFIEKEGDYKSVVPFNHYESPYPDIREVRKKEEKIFDKNKSIFGIDFNVQVQLEHLHKMREIEPMDWKNFGGERRYYYNNAWFGKGSADVLYYMLRMLKPKKVIEVGSGFSTAAMLDVNNVYFENSIEINSIEPYPERLRSLLREGDNLEIHEKKLQDIPLEYFETLQENDILFIDSSHVSHADSDVNYYLFEIMPRLKKGVYIHIHDVYYPFIYPSEWIYEGRAYNEAYLLRAFLMNNSYYSIQFFNDMLMHKYPTEIKCMEAFGGSIWLRKEI